MASEAALTSKQICEFLRRLHTESDQWVYFEELATATGSRAENRLDAWAMHLWPSTNFKRVTYEIKVSRGDFLRELKSPQKRKLGLLYSNLFYFVTPRGLVKPNEVPPEAGLIEFDADGSPRYPVAAPWREGNRPSFGFMAAAFRQAQRLADSRVETSVRARHKSIEDDLAYRTGRLNADRDVLRGQERALQDEWQKCKEAQQAAGLNPPMFLRPKE